MFYAPIRASEILFTVHVNLQSSLDLYPISFISFGPGLLSNQVLISLLVTFYRIAQFSHVPNILDLHRPTLIGSECGYFGGLSPGHVQINQSRDRMDGPVGGGDPCPRDLRQLPLN